MIAVLAMIADHVGLIFFPEVLVLRIIGRLALPIFAFLIAEGYSKTHDVKKYLLRLGIFALISHIPHTFALQSAGIENPSLNIFFTLFVGLLAIIAIEKCRSLVLKIIFVTSLLLIAEVGMFDYGAYGVLLIVGFSFLSSYYYLGISTIVISTLMYTTLRYNTTMGLLQPLSLLALFPILSYKNYLGIRISKWWFYWFYPVHLFILGLIKTIF